MLVPNKPNIFFIIDCSLMLFIWFFFRKEEFDRKGQERSLQVTVSKAFYYSRSLTSLSIVEGIIIRSFPSL